MGSSQSSAPPSRPLTHLSDLQFFDLLLIRSSLIIAHQKLDDRIAHSIHATISGYHSNPVIKLPPYNRVGLLLTPSRTHPSDYTLENLLVVEATSTGIASRSLANVYASSETVVVRQLILNNSNLTEDRKQEQPTFHTSDAEGNLIFNISTQKSAEQLQKEKTKQREVEKRIELVGKYYQFVGPLINRSYEDVKEQLMPLFKFVHLQLLVEEVTEEQMNAMRILLEKFTETGTNLIKFDNLIPLFHTINAQDNIKTTFSDAELTDLVNEFQKGSLSNESNSSPPNTLTKDQFLLLWLSSLQSHTEQFASSASALSGGFISLVFQKLGLIPENEKNFVLPSEFAVGGKIGGDNTLMNSITLIDCELSEEMEVVSKERRELGT